MVEETRPVNPRRRRKSKMEIFKEAYLPIIIIALTALMIFIFLVGSLVKAIWPSTPSVDETGSSSSEPSEDAYAAEIDSLLAQAAALAENYEYQAAADLIDTFSGDLSAYPALLAAQQEYLQMESNMVTWTPEQVTCLSMNMLIVDLETALSDAEYGTSYNKNFITVDEFSAILEQLYDNGYILVNITDYASCTTDDSGHITCEAVELRLPVGKKPLVLIETNVNYYSYMVDADRDGVADAGGDGFASKMLIAEDGSITCERTDSDGNVTTGAYDVVPILDAFIAEHPDFSYRGAKAVLAFSGYDGVFGYRTNADVATTLGEEFYDSEVAAATELAAALKEDGYVLACYTYSNTDYSLKSASEIQSEIRSWEAEVTPIVGEIDLFVFARNEIEDYTDSKFNALSNGGYRYFVGFGSSVTGAEIGEAYFLQKRVNITGSGLYNTPSLYSDCFSASTVIDSARGEVPVA